MDSEIKAVLFDLGGTLIYFDGVWPQVMQAADGALLEHLHRKGFEVDRTRFKAAFRAELTAYYTERDTEFIEYTTAYVLRKVLGEFGYPDVPDDTLAEALETLYAVSQAHWKVEADAIDTLATLREAGFPMGILSNAADDQDVQTLVDRAKLRGYVDFVLSSAACGIRKPNPRIFQIALEHWDFEPAEVAMVGDTLGADILGAQHAGLYSVWVTRRAETPGNRDHAETIQPDVQVDTLADLVPLFVGKAAV